MVLENLILGTGKDVNWLELATDYADYIIDLKNELENKSMVDIGFSSRDYDFVNKYKIDTTTHLCNLFRTKEYVKSLDFRRYELK